MIPTIRLPSRFRIASKPAPSSASLLDSYMNVEKVVYAPTNPTAIARRVVSETLCLTTKLKNQPKKKLPEILMTNVASGRRRLSRPI